MPGSISDISIKVQRPGTDPTITIKSPHGTVVIKPLVFESFETLHLGITTVAGRVEIEQR
jgi:hypothetical protein